MTKNISLADDAYETLKRMKRPDESFSDLARRLGDAHRPASILDLVGIWKGRGEDVEAMKRLIYDERDRSVRDPVRL